MKAETKERIAKNAKNAADSLTKAAKDSMDLASELITKEEITEMAQKTKETAEKVIGAVAHKVEGTAKKVRTKKILLDKEFFIEYSGKQFSEKYITDKFFELWQENNSLSEVKTLKIYYKIEEETAYCVVNDSETIAVRLQD